jgi:hypothetical protein
MAERDRAAMRIDEVGIVLDAQLPQDSNTLRGEGRHAAAFLIKHMAVHDNALAERLTLVLQREVLSFSRTVS